jgi:hypothetical protein
MMQTRSGPKPRKPGAIHEFAEAEETSSAQKRSVRDAIRKLTFGPAADTCEDEGGRASRRDAVPAGKGEE